MRVRWKEWLLALASIGLVALIAEIGLRIFWTYGQFAFKSYQSAPYLFETKYWKAWHYPATSIHFVKDCLDVRYSTNSDGMRGREVDPDRPRITLLGDSYVEGYGVDDDATIGALIEPLLDNNVQALNFGVSGGFGTVHELALYHNYARHFRAAWVVLFFVNYNDLYDNINAVDEDLVDEDFELAYPVAGGLAEMRRALVGNPPAGITFSSPLVPYLYRLLYRSFGILRESVQYWSNVRTDFKTALIDVYAEPESKAVRNGWIVTRRSLARLKALTAEDGARLLVVDLADPYQIDSNWVKIAAMKSEGKKQIDPKRPNRKLEGICRDLEIPYYDMYDEVMSHIKKYGLQYPYLSHMCDRHYTREGNLITARFLAPKLKALMGGN